MHIETAVYVGMLSTPSVDTDLFGLFNGLFVVHLLKHLPIIVGLVAAL